MKKYLKVLLLLLLIPGTAQTGMSWKKYNRIVQTSTNTLNLVRSALLVAILGYSTYTTYKWAKQAKAALAKFDANALKEFLSPKNETLEQYKARIPDLGLDEQYQHDIQRLIEQASSRFSSYADTNMRVLEQIFGLPWKVYTRDNLDLKNAKTVLDTEHYGLQNVKDHILDYLATFNMRKDGNPPIVCLVGPPGVGKTTIANSIAKCLGRSCERISLGGVHDEGEIRGYNRTYHGARPGRIITALKSAKSMNPAMILDEIDKVGQRSHNGDPCAALLEVLDPAQNSAFRDNYIEIPVDLSRVLFIATANDLDAIPRPLRDRMLIISLPSYTLQEKLVIARNHLLSKTIKKSGLEDKAQALYVSDDLLRTLITHYTYESGVRELERILTTLCSKVARSLLEQGTIPALDTTTIEQYLGPRRSPSDQVLHVDTIGSANGLAWTSVGGCVLQVEALLMPGKGELMLTGQLGEVMQESAKAALSYVRAHAQELDINPDLFKTNDLHIHFPEGSTPKDGPSAGITILSCIASAFTQRPIDHRYAMTGEINLHGDILPIGGVREKILAAQRNGIKFVILPEKNRADLAECKDIKNGTTETIFAEHACDVIKLMLKEKGDSIPAQ